MYLRKATFRILLLYKRHNTPWPQFYELLQYITLAHNIDIIAGDFNSKPNEQLDLLLNDYEQLVVEPTHIAGSTLDHIYIKKTMKTYYNVQINTHHTFFSDHAAVKIFLGKI